MKNVPEILALWSKLTGFDPEAKRWTMGDYDIRKMSEEIAKAQRLDPTDGLALMLVEASLDSFLGSRSFTASQMLADLPKHFEFLKDAQALRKLLHESGMPEAREELKDWVRKALGHYRALHREDIQKLLENRDDVAFLWRDALVAIDESLETHQFMQGEPEPAGTMPAYHDHVLGAFTPNGLLQAMTGMPSGILISMVRDPVDAIHSYFVFGIRNGGTLSLLTDRTDWKHPLQRKLSRRPERELGSRMQRSWFPYSVLDIQYVYDEDGALADVYVEREEGLIPNEFTARRMKPIAELTPQETVWIAMMFNLIARKFFHRDFKTPELSYLGEQVRTVTAMEIGAASRNLPVVDYAPLEAKPLRSSELVSAVIPEMAKVEPGTGVHAWMEERYKDRVDDALLNVLGKPTRQEYLLTHAGEVKPGSLSKWRDRGQVAQVDRKLELFDATYFGSRERLLADRVFIARHNQAQAIERLASMEFEERRKEVQDWWLATMKGRKEALLAAIGEGRFDVFSQTLVDGPRFNTVPAGERNLLTVRHLESFDSYEYPHMHSGVVLTDDENARSGWAGESAWGEKWPYNVCAISGFKTSWRARFKPVVADHLAALAGVGVNELPDVLRHWNASNPYGGNHILDRIDPLDWSIQDPWCRISFDVDIWLAERGMKKLCKQAGREVPSKKAKS